MGNGDHITVVDDDWSGCLLYCEIEGEHRRRRGFEYANAGSKSVPSKDCGRIFRERCERCVEIEFTFRRLGRWVSEVADCQIWVGHADIAAISLEPVPFFARQPHLITAGVQAENCCR